ncbi:MAG: class I SAM-dependent methyltransferase, partial [Acidimicrobiales bacterium]
SADHPMRRVTRAVAFDADGWTAERRGKVADLFDSLAEEWHTRDAPGRDAPLRDALERGLSAADQVAAVPALQAAMAAVTTTEVPIVHLDDPDRRPGGSEAHFGFGDDDDLPSNDPPSGSVAAINDGFRSGFVPRAPRRLCVDIGAGTGLYSTTLAARFPLLLSVDLSGEMLRLAPAGPAIRVQADASTLPLGDGSVDVLVLANAFLFPHEAQRALAPDGVVIWVNSRGTETPIHLTADEVDTALPGRWDGVASQAGWGTWSVHWRAASAP